MLATIAGEYHFIIIDCPPSLGMLTINALNASSEYLVPMQTEYYAVEGFLHLEKIINNVREYLNPDIKNLNTIRSQALLKELISYSLDINADRVSALLVLMI